MTNKFRGLQPLQPGADSARQAQVGMDGGFRGDLTPRQIPMNSTPELLDIRFERSGIRKDFGWTPIGAPAPFAILGLIEHKYIDALLQFHRLVRVYRNGTNNAVIEVWDGVNWVVVDTSVETILNVYLSIISAQSCVYFADGQQILEWCEVLEKFPQEDDFPMGNQQSTVTVGGVTAVINPGDAAVLDYTINYDVVFASSFGMDTQVILEFIHNVTPIGEVIYEASQFDSFPLSFLNEAFTFSRQVSLGDFIIIRIKEITGGSIVHETDIIATSNGAGDPDFSGVKTPATAPAVSNRFEYHYNISGVVAIGSFTLTISFWYRNGGAWIQAADTVYNLGVGGYNITDSFIVDIPGLIDPAAQFGIQGRRNPAQGTSANFGAGTRNVQWDRGDVDFFVHCHNKVNDLDATAGVTYELAGPNSVSQLRKIDPGPGGRFLIQFARRLVVLRNYGDSQAIAFSRDGILFDFTGVGSGEIALVEARGDTHGDAVDDLMGAAVLGSNFLAIFRRRSIWRGLETGNVQLAVGAVSWLENLGTTSPFSISHVRGGAMFLGQDMMVYYLTEQGYTAVGHAIQQELIETLQASGLNLVDSNYDPVFGEYWLGVPESGAANITKVWIFNVNRFLDKQEMAWRTRAMNVARFALASEVE